MINNSVERLVINNYPVTKQKFKMRKISLIIALLVLISSYSKAQYKEIPYKTQTKLKSSGLILGFLNPKSFELNHSFNFSYYSMGNTSVSLASYTGTVSYKILSNLKVSADITLQYSPFASLGGSSGSLLNKDFQNSFRGINLSRISLDYQPSANVSIQINYFNNKNSYLLYNNYFNHWNDF
jgi:hypothetical protein